MRLESFILTNAGQSIEGGSFRYDSIIIDVRCYSSGIYEASMHYPAPEWVFVACFDIRKMEDYNKGILTALHTWIQNIFLPAAEAEFTKLILKKQKGN